MKSLSLRSIPFSSIEINILRTNGTDPCWQHEVKLPLNWNTVKLASSLRKILAALTSKKTRLHNQFLQFALAFTACLAQKPTLYFCHHLAIGLVESAEEVFPLNDLH